MILKTNSREAGTKHVGGTSILMMNFDRKSYPDMCSHMTIYSYMFCSDSELSSVVSGCNGHPHVLDADHRRREWSSFADYSYTYVRGIPTYAAMQVLSPCNINATP